MLTDRELADRVTRLHDQDAFRELYRRHTPRLYGLLLRLLGGRRSDSEDALQEVWMRAVSTLVTFRWEASLPSWLARIGVNVARELLRNERTVTEDARDLLTPAVNGSARLDVDRALQSLPDRARAVLVLHDLEGWTHEEIGALLGIASGTSKSHLFSARRAMRAFLAPEGHIPWRSKVRS